MIIRAISIIVLGIFVCVFSITDSGVSPGQPAYAGGEGGNNATKPKSENKAKPAKETDKAKQKRIKEGLALVEKLKDHIEKNAKDNKLRNIATDINQLRYLQQSLDRAYALLDGTKQRNTPNDINKMLNQMSRSKDKALKFYAQNTKRGINTHREMWDAQDIGRLYDQALTSGSELDKIDLKIKYERAVDEYHAAARKIPVELRHAVFQPMPDIPKGTRPKTFK